MASTPKSIPWFAPKFVGTELHALQAVIDSGFINDGPKTAEFERQIAAYLGVKHAVAVTSGTAALTMALIAYGVGRGDDVLVPDLTFIATANAVTLAGANPVLVDVDPLRHVVTLDALENAITRRTKAIVTVEVNGRCPDYASIVMFCARHNLALITDSCEALGSFYGNRMAGTLGNAGCFSFSPNKLITTGQGGMVVTNNGTIYDRLRELKDQGRSQRGTGGRDLHPALGFNFKFTDLQAAVGLAQLQMLHDRIRAVKQRNAWYRSELDGYFELPITAEENFSLWFDVLTEGRLGLVAFLRSQNIGTREFWLPIHRQVPYTWNRAFPGATAASNKGIWLPSGFDMTESDVSYVVDVIKKGRA